MSSPVSINVSEILDDWQYNLYKIQKTIRFLVLSIGRQAGKTFFCVILICIKALKKDDSINWWVAPIYDQAKIAFRRCQTFLSSHKVPHKVNKSELTITFRNGSVIYFKSADKEDSLRGETVDFMVIDEMAVIKRDTWLFALRGTITATMASVVFIGTPKGKTIFYDMSLMGQDPLEKDWAFYQYASNISRFFSEKEWEDVQKLPERVFQQEYLAEFIDDGGEVFRGIRDCIHGDFQEPIRKRHYFMGVDLAKSHDYTVIIVLDDRGHLVYYDRFNDIAWTIQKKRIIDVAEHYSSATLIDSTGLGDPILDDLSLHINVEGYKFSNISKRQLIENLAIGIERGTISFPEITELINELSIFTFDQTIHGNIRYNSPPGMHDDIVIALALAYIHYTDNSGMSESFSDIGSREMVSDIWTD